MPEEQKPDQDPGQSGDKVVAAPAVTEFNPSDFTMKINGDDVLVKDKEELIRYAQMGHDYTAKTQALSKQRENFAQSVEDRALELYRQALEKKGPDANGTEGSEKTGDEDPNAALDARIKQLETQGQARSQAEEHKAQDQELNTVMKSLSDRHKLSKDDQQIVLIRFRDQVSSESDVDQLLDSLAAQRATENKEREQEIIQKYIKVKTEDPFASGETGKSGESGSDLAKEPKTFAEARARADARLNAPSGI